MNLFTRNSPYYHPLKYLLFLLKHPVYATHNSAEEKDYKIMSVTDITELLHNLTLQSVYE